MKKVMATSLAVLAAAFAAPAVEPPSAQAHVYSWNSGQADAKTVISWKCGAFTWTCSWKNSRPYIVICGAHSWCLPDPTRSGTHQERHAIYKHTRACVATGRFEHGRIVRHGERCN